MCDTNHVKGLVFLYIYNVFGNDVIMNIQRFNVYFLDTKVMLVWFAATRVNARVVRHPVFFVDYTI